MKVRFLAVVEVDLDEISPANPVALAEMKLNAFRESVRPSAEYGISIYRTDAQEAFDGDLLPSGLSIER